MTNRYCKRCEQSTEHREFRLNSAGEEGESVGERLLIGFITLGFSEAMAEHRYECQQCGRKT